LTQAAAAAVPEKARLGAELAWASGSFATGALFNGMALFALFFMTTFLSIEPAVAGTILLIIRLYDGIIDPLIGTISDRTNHRWGPRRIYLLIGAIGMGASFALFFNQPTSSSISTAAMTLLILMLYSTAYSVFSIPYLAMPPEIAPSYDGRTRLMSFRVFFQLAGVTAGSVGAPFLIQLVGGDLAGYQLMGLVLGILATALCLVVFIGAAFLPPSVRPRPVPFDGVGKLLASPFVDTARVFSNAPFRLLTLVKLFQLAVLATVLACTPYFFGFVLKLDTGQIGTYFLAFTVAGLIALPIMRVLIARYGKRECYIALIALYAVALASWYLWEAGESQIWFFARAIAIGTLGTGTLLCALSMLPDTMEYDRLQSKQSREGVMSGVFTFVEALAGAIGPFLIGLLLQAQGLVQGRGPDIVQPQSVLDAVQIGVSLVPAILCLLAIPLLLRYRLDEALLVKMRAEDAA